MQQPEWKVFEAFAVDGGQMPAAVYLSNGKRIYRLGEEDSSSAPLLENVYRVVYYPLEKPADPKSDPTPLLVLDVLPKVTFIDFSNGKLTVAARIYTPLAYWPVRWQTELAVSGGGQNQELKYDLISIWLDSQQEVSLKYDKAGPKVGDYLLQFLSEDYQFPMRFVGQDAQRQFRFTRLSGVPGFFLKGLKLPHLEEGLDLKLPQGSIPPPDQGVDGIQCLLGFFVKAADIWNDKRQYYVLAFSLSSDLDRSRSSFRLFKPEPESFKFSNELWRLVHRPAITISPNYSPLDPAEPTQASILHIYNIPVENTAKLWNQQADSYHDSLNGVSGGQSVSFLPQLDATVATSRWIMTYQITTFTNEIGWYDPYRFPRNPTTSVQYDGVVVFYIGGPVAQNRMVEFQPRSLHLSSLQPVPLSGPTPEFPLTAHLPQVFDVGGSPLQLDLRASATVFPRNDAVEFDRLDQAERVYGIAINTPGAITRSIPASGEGVVRMGALDLSFGGEKSVWSTKTGWLIVRPDEPLRVHVDAYFNVTDIQPGGQDDPSQETYVAESNVALGSNSCAAPLLSATSTKEERESANFDAEVSAGFRRKRPLVIHLDDTPSAAHAYALRVQEDVVPRLNRAVKLNLYSQNPANPEQPPADFCSTPGLRRAVILDRSPFLVAEVRYTPFEGVGANQSSVIATWDNTVPQGSAWMLQFRQQPFCLVLPPQGVGEEMVKGTSTDRPDPLPKALPFRFSPPALLSVNPRPSLSSFAEAPWNLRRILGTPPDPTPGPMVTSMHYELLYGLSCDATNPAFRLAELFARVGQIANARDVNPAGTLTSLQQATYNNSRKDWSKVYQRYLSRIAVLEPWAGLANSPATSVTLKDNLTCRIRSTADMADPITLANHAGSNASLRGGVTWGFESKNIYDQVMQRPTATGTLESFALSSLGGWGKQYADFLGGLTKVYADVEMGRTSVYKLERIGRISIWYTLAKHVIVYERSVTPSRQFFNEVVKEQPPYFGMPVPRKVREYVEILEDSRPYPDNLTSSATSQQILAQQACGPVNSILLKKGAQFNVDSAWGGDVSGRTGIGWKIPLWNPSAWPPDVYPKPVIGVGAISADPSSTTNGSASGNNGSSASTKPPHIDNPEALTFFTLTGIVKGGIMSPDVDPDPHNWAPFEGVDYVNAPSPAPPPDFAGGSLQQTVPKPSAVAPNYGPCTFRLVPGPVPVNLVANRAAKPMAAVLESITVVRAVAASTSPAQLPPMAAAVQAIQDQVHTLAGTVFRALPVNVDPSKTVTADLINELKNAATGPIADLRTKITTAQMALSSVATQYRTAAAGFEKGLRDRYLSNLNTTIDTFMADYQYGVNQLKMGVFDANLAKQFFQSQQRNFEESLMFPSTMPKLKQNALATVVGTPATPGALASMVARYTDAVMAIKATVDSALNQFQAAITNWNTQKDSIVKTLNNQLAQAQAIAEGLKSARPPSEQFPNLYAWAASILGPILTDIGKDAADLIDKLNAAAAVPANELAVFKMTPFYQAISMSYPPSILTLVQNAVGGAIANQDEVYKALHKFDVWINGYTPVAGGSPVTGQVALWAMQCQNILNNLADATALDASVMTLDTYLRQTVTAAAKKLLGNSEGHTDLERLGELGVQAQTVVNAFNTELSEVQGQISAAVSSFEGQLQATAQNIGKQLTDFTASLESQRDALAQTAETYIDKTFRQCIPDTSVFQTADTTFRLLRAFGAPPQVPNLNFGRDKLAYFFQEIEPSVNMTPVLSAAAQAGQAFNALKTVGVNLPTVGTLDQLVPPSLKGFGLADIFGNFAGLDLSHLFPGLTLPDLSTDAVKVTQDMDPQTMRATMRADINFTITDSSTLFTIGPVSVQIVTAVFNATVTISAGADGIRRTASGNITGNWQLVLSGTPFVKLNKTELQFDDSGGIRFSINPKSVELPGVLKLVTDLLNSVLGKDSGLTVGMLPDGFQSILNLPVPDIPYGPEIGSA